LFVKLGKNSFLSSKSNFIGGFFSKLLAIKNYILIWRFGAALGDHILLTGMVKFFSDKKFKLIVITDKPEIFSHYEFEHIVFKLDKLPQPVLRVISITLTFLESERIKRFRFNEKKYGPLRGFQNRNKPLKYANYHAYDWGDISFENFRADIKLLPTDKFNLSLVGQSYALVNPIGKTSFTRKKNWSFEKYQETIDSINNIIWVQVGYKEDKLLNGVIDLRGKTSMRNLFFLVSKSKLVLANEGLMNHIASAFPNVRSFIPLSGYNREETLKYPNTIFIKEKIKSHCSPCFDTEPCDMICFSSVLPRDVIKKIKKEMSW